MGLEPQIKPHPEGDPIWSPMPGKVVVKLAEERQFGELWIPDAYKNIRIMGTVIAISGDERLPEDDEDPDTGYYDLKIGDRVIFGPHSGVQVRVGRSMVLILHTAEILSRVSFEGEQRAEFIPPPVQPEED